MVRLVWKWTICGECLAVGERVLVGEYSSESTSKRFGFEMSSLYGTLCPNWLNKFNRVPVCAICTINWVRWWSSQTILQPPDPRCISMLGHHPKGWATRSESIRYPDCGLRTASKACRRTHSTERMPLKSCQDHLNNFEFFNTFRKFSFYEYSKDELKFLSFEDVFFDFWTTCSARIFQFHQIYCRSWAVSVELLTEFRSCEEVRHWEVLGKAA